MRYRQNELNGMLIGDAGYPALPFLLMPISNPTTDEEIRFDTKNTIIVKSNILIIMAIYRVTNGHNDQNNK